MGRVYYMIDGVVQDGVLADNVLFNNGETVKEDIYSDRLMQWDFKKHDKLLMKHFGDKGQYWSGREPEKVEAFLKDFTGQDIVLCKITEYENKSNGYPYWRFGYYEKGKTYSY